MRIQAVRSTQESNVLRIKWGRLDLARHRIRRRISLFCEIDSAQQTDITCHNCFFRFCPINFNWKIAILAVAVLYRSGVNTQCMYALCVHSATVARRLRKINRAVPCTPQLHGVLRSSRRKSFAEGFMYASPIARLCRRTCQTRLL